MLVKDIMIRDVASIAPTATIREAMREMRRRDVKSLVVEKVHDTDAYGLITYTNILRTIVAEEGDIDLINVYDICIRPIISVPEMMEVKFVARLMVQLGIRRVAVLHGNDLVGLISMNDIISAIIELAD